MQNISVPTITPPESSDIDELYAAASNACVSNQGECYYLSDQRNSLSLSNYGYVFHPDKWPHESNCVPDNSNCFDPRELDCSTFSNTCYYYDNGTMTSNNFPQVTQSNPNTIRCVPNTPSNCRTSINVQNQIDCLASNYQCYGLFDDSKVASKVNNSSNQLYNVSDETCSSNLCDYSLDQAKEVVRNNCSNNDLCYAYNSNNQSVSFIDDSDAGSLSNAFTDGKLVYFEDKGGDGAKCWERTCLNNAIQDIDPYALCSNNPATCHYYTADADNGRSGTISSSNVPRQYNATNSNCTNPCEYATAAAACSAQSNLCYNLENDQIITVTPTYSINKLDGTTCTNTCTFNTGQEACDYKGTEICYSLSNGQQSITNEKYMYNGNESGGTCGLPDTCALNQYSNCPFPTSNQISESDWSNMDSNQQSNWKDLGSNCPPDNIDPTLKKKGHIRQIASNVGRSDNGICINDGSRSNYYRWSPSSNNEHPTETCEINKQACTSNMINNWNNIDIGVSEEDQNYRFVIPTRINGNYPLNIFEDPRSNNKETFHTSWNNNESWSNMLHLCGVEWTRTLSNDTCNPVTENKKDDCEIGQLESYSNVSFSIENGKAYLTFSAQAEYGALKSHDKEFSFMNEDGYKEYNMWNNSNTYYKFILNEEHYDFQGNNSEHVLDTYTDPHHATFKLKLKNINEITNDGVLKGYYTRYREIPNDGLPDNKQYYLSNATFPNCTYSNVYTDNSNNYTSADIGKTDCANKNDLGYGAMYNWTLESSDNGSTWKAVKYENKNIASDQACNRISDSISNQTTAVYNTGSNAMCDCYEMKSFKEDPNSNTNSENPAFDETPPGVKWVAGKERTFPGFCEFKTYYNAKVKKSECTTGEKIKDVTSVENHPYYDPETCCNVCLSGSSNGNPEKCEHDSNINKYIYNPIKPDIYDADNGLSTSSNNILSALNQTGVCQLNPDCKPLCPFPDIGDDDARWTTTDSYETVCGASNVGSNIVRTVTKTASNIPRSSDDNCSDDKTTSNYTRTFTSNIGVCPSLECESNDYDTTMYYALSNNSSTDQPVDGTISSNLDDVCGLSSEQTCGTVYSYFKKRESSVCTGDDYLLQSSDVDCSLNNNCNKIDYYFDPGSFILYLEIYHPPPPSTLKTISLNSIKFKLNNVAFDFVFPLYGDILPSHVKYTRSEPYQAIKIVLYDMLISNIEENITNDSFVLTEAKIDNLIYYGDISNLTKLNMHTDDISNYTFLEYVVIKHVFKLHVIHDNEVYYLISPDMFNGEERKDPFAIPQSYSGYRFSITGVTTNDGYLEKNQSESIVTILNFDYQEDKGLFVVSLGNHLNSIYQNMCVYARKNNINNMYDIIILSQEERKYLKYSDTNNLNEFTEDKNEIAILNVEIPTTSSDIDRITKFRSAYEYDNKYLHFTLHSDEDLGQLEFNISFKIRDNENIIFFGNSTTNFKNINNANTYSFIDSRYLTEDEGKIIFRSSHRIELESFLHTNSLSDINYEQYEDLISPDGVKITMYTNKKTFSDQRLDYQVDYDDMVDVNYSYTQSYDTTSAPLKISIRNFKSAATYHQIENNSIIYFCNKTNTNDDKLYVDGSFNKDKMLINPDDNIITYLLLKINKVDYPYDNISYPIISNSFIYNVAITNQTDHKIILIRINRKEDEYEQYLDTNFEITFKDDIGNIIGSLNIWFTLYMEYESKNYIKLTNNLKNPQYGFKKRIEWAVGPYGYVGDIILKDGYENNIPFKFHKDYSTYEYYGDYYKYWKYEHVSDDFYMIKGGQDAGRNICSSSDYRLNYKITNVCKSSTYSYSNIRLHHVGNFIGNEMAFVDDAQISDNDNKLFTIWINMDHNRGPIAEHNIHDDDYILIPKLTPTIMYSSTNFRDKITIS